MSLSKSHPERFQGAGETDRRETVASVKGHAANAGGVERADFEGVGTPSFARVSHAVDVESPFLVVMDPSHMTPGVIKRRGLRQLVAPWWADVHVDGVGTAVVLGADVKQGAVVSVEASAKKRRSF